MKRIATIAILAVIISAVQAQSSLSLDQLIEKGLQQNLHLQNTRLETEKSRKMIKSSWDIGLTQGTLQRGQINSVLLDNYWTIQQDFGNPVQSIIRTGYLKQQTKVTQQRSKQEEAMLRMNISVAYNHAVYLQSKLKLARYALIRTEDYQKIMNLRFETGETNMLEKLNLENQLALFKNQVELTEAEYRKSLRTIRQLINSDSLFIPADDSLKIIPWNGDTTLKHPALSVLDEEIKSSYKLMHTQKAGFAPTVNAGYFNQQLDHVSNFQGYQVGIGLPLWFLNKQTEIQTSRISVLQKENEKIYTEHEMKSELESIIDQLRIYSTQLDFFRTSLLSNAAQALSKARMMYEQGEIGYIEYWNHFNNSYQVETEYLDLVSAYNELIYLHAYYTNNN